MTPRLFPLVPRAHVTTALALALIALPLLAPAQVPTRPEVPAGTQAHYDLPYVEGGFERQRLDLFVPEGADGPLPLVIWVHGGGWNKGDKSGCPPLRAGYTRRGYAVASVNYRLSGDAVFPAQIEDCKAAVRWLRAHAKKYNLDPGRFGIWGRSAGGHLVALLGTSGGVAEFERGANRDVSSRVQAVADFCGPTDFLQADTQALPGGRRIDEPGSIEWQLIGGSPSDEKNLPRVRLANPVSHVTPDDPPFLIVHGDRDMAVPPGQSELLYDALRRAGVPVHHHTIRNMGHGIVAAGNGSNFSGPEIAALVGDFFDHHLRGMANAAARWPAAHRSASEVRPDLIVTEELRSSLWLDGSAGAIDHGDVLDAVMTGSPRQMSFLTSFWPEATDREMDLLAKWEGSNDRQFLLRSTRDHRIAFLQSDEGTSTSLWVETQRMFPPAGRFCFVAVQVDQRQTGAANVVRIWVDGEWQPLVVLADAGRYTQHDSGASLRVSSAEKSTSLRGYINAYGIVAGGVSEAALQGWYNGGRPRRFEDIFPQLVLNCRFDPASVVWDPLTDIYTLRNRSGGGADGRVAGIRQSAVDYSINPYGLNAPVFEDDLASPANWMVSDVPGESTRLEFGREGLVFRFAHTGPPTGINRHQAITRGSYPLRPGTKLVVRVNYDWSKGSLENAHSGFFLFADRDQDGTNAYFGILNPADGDQYKIKAKEGGQQAFPDVTPELRLGLPTGVPKGKDVMIKIDGDTRRIEWAYDEGGREVGLGGYNSHFADRVRVRFHGRDWNIFPTPDEVVFKKFRIYYE